MEKVLILKNTENKCNNLAKPEQNLSFVVSGHNGTWMIDKTLQDLGWRKIADNKSENFRLKWVELKSNINYENFKEGEQMVNRIPNCYLLTNKLGLLTSLQRFERIWNLMDMARYTKISKFDFYPETYRLDDPLERKTFLSVYKPEDLWICKPIGLNQGRGISLIRDIDEFKQSTLERINDQRSYVVNTDLIVQRYIKNPLLLDRKKFDLRVFMLVASTQPFLVFYRKGYARLSLLPYDPEADELTVHLTNQFIQRKDPAYESRKNETVWSFEKLNSYINKKLASAKGLETDWLYNNLTNQIKEIMLICFHSVKSKLKTKLGYFDLYGLDFMIDDNMKLWLIEVNANPCLSTNCDTLRSIIPDVIQETLYLAIECFEKSRRNMALYPLRNYRNFEVLYNGSSNFSLDMVAKMRKSSNLQPFLSHFVPPKADEIPVSPSTDYYSRNLSMSIVFGRDLTDDFHPVKRDDRVLPPASMFELSSWSERTKEAVAAMASTRSNLSSQRSFNSAANDKLSSQIEAKVCQNAPRSSNALAASGISDISPRIDKKPNLITEDSETIKIVEQKISDETISKSAACKMHAMYLTENKQSKELVKTESKANCTKPVISYQRQDLNLKPSHQQMLNTALRETKAKEKVQSKTDIRVTNQIDVTSLIRKRSKSDSFKQDSVQVSARSSRSELARSLRVPSKTESLHTVALRASKLLLPSIKFSNTTTLLNKTAAVESSPICVTSKQLPETSQNTELNRLIKSIRESELLYEKAVENNRRKIIKRTEPSAISRSYLLQQKELINSSSRSSMLSTNVQRTQERMEAEARLKEMQARYQPNVFSMAFNETPRFRDSLTDRLYQKASKYARLSPIKSDVKKA